MNEETPALPPPPPASTVETQPPPRRGAGWAVLVAVLALAGAAAAGWQAWQTRQQLVDMREVLARRLETSDAAAAEARTLVHGQQEALAQLQGKVGALESKAEATEGQAAALESLYQEFSRSREDRVLAEVDHAVSMAAQQLQLAGNVAAALVALEGAEARLASVDRGQLAPLRRALAHDIDALKAQPQVDVPGIALRLEKLLERVDTLPLAFAGAPAATAPQAAPPAAGGDGSALDFVRALGRQLWHEVRDLVRVERLDRPEPALLSPAQTTYLRENVKIRLLTARLALLSRDGRTYSADLGQARAWIERYFDTRDERVAAVLRELAALESTPVVIELPSLVESFAALREMQARSAQPSSAEPAPAPEAPPAPAPDKAGQGAAPARPGR